MDLVLGFGGNTGNVPATFAWAARQIAQRFPVKGRSRMYLTEPQGPSQPWFFNAALLLQLSCPPLALLEFCQDLEQQAGRRREREPRWGPRPLDLDLLVAPHLVVEHPRLQLPHPRLAQRRFALLPAAEVAPQLRHPRLQTTLSQLARQLSPDNQACSLVGPFP